MLKVSAFKVATHEIDLEPYGGEGKIKVKGLNSKVQGILAEIQKEYGKFGADNALANYKASIAICKNCIVEAPFKVTDEEIDDFPPELLEEIVLVVLNAKENKIPLS